MSGEQQGVMQQGRSWKVRSLLPAPVHPPEPMFHHTQVHDTHLNVQVQQRWAAAPHHLPLTLAAAQPWRNPCWQRWRRPWPAGPSCSPNHPHHQPQPLQ